MSDKIYTITCLEKIEEYNTWPSFGEMKFMGYTFDKQQAFELVENNACDINETVFDFVAVEEIYEGLYAFPRRRWFFQYDAGTDRYFQIEEPEIMKNVEMSYNEHTLSELDAGNGIDFFENIELDKYILRVYTDIVNRTGKPAWRAETWRAERKHRLRPFYLMRIMPP